MAVLTSAWYWSQLPLAAKNKWHNLSERQKNLVVCTHRPDARIYKGDQLVRRCSSSGKWGRAADYVRLDIAMLLADGYEWQTR